MTDYNPRPSRSRRDSTFEKLRVALPVPSVSEDDSRFGTDGGGYGDGILDAQSERKEGGERESRWDNAGGGDRCPGDVSGGDHRDRLDRGPLASADDVDGVDRCEGVTVSAATECHRESYGSDSQGCLPSEAFEGNEGSAVGVNNDGDAIVGTLVNPPLGSVENSRPTVAEDEIDQHDVGASGRQGSEGRVATAELRKRPATSQRKVRRKNWMLCMFLGSTYSMRMVFFCCHSRAHNDRRFCFDLIPPGRQKRAGPPCSRTSRGCSVYST